MDSDVAKVKLLFPVLETLKLSTLLSCRTIPLPITPEIDPPTVKMLPQTIWTLATLPDTVPVPFATLHVWTGALG